jgi:restriction system protein
MPIPDFQSLMLPLLNAVSDGGDHTNREITASFAKTFALTEEELTRLLPSGQQRVLTNRVSWAKAYLKKAGLLDSPARGVLRITDAGRKALSSHPAVINIGFLKQFSQFDWHGQPNRSDEITEVEETGSTPEELLEASYQTLRDEVAAELLEKLKRCLPSFFERIVVQLLVAMGYGGSLADAGQAIGRAGDGGIDGIIKEDKLGLDVVCVQAKRWEENTVGRPMVQAFAGSMEGYRAKKGVLLTTSTFSKDAYDYVSRIERRIVLIDGKTLAQLMIDHDIGVTTRRTYVVKQMDSDFFLEEDV